MKKFRLICVLLAAIMLLASCAGGGADVSKDTSENGEVPNLSGDYVLKYGDLTVDEYDYMFLASMFKDRIVYYQQSLIYQSSGQVVDEKEILSTKLPDSDETIADYIADSVRDLAMQMIITEKLCADAGIKVTDQESLDKIKSYIDDLEYAYGGADLFDIALVRMGFTRSAIERYNRFSYLYELYSDYRYGENGVSRVPESSVNDYFLKNYYRYCGAVFPYKDSEGNAISYDYTDEEIEEYFNTDFVKVAHVLYKTGEVSAASGGRSIVPYSDEKLAEIEKKANAAFEAINSGESVHADYKSDNEDLNYEYVFTHGEMVSEFEKAAFEMQPGEVRLVKTEYGYHLMLKEELTEEDLRGTTASDGTVSGSRVEDVKASMSKAKIREMAMKMLEDLKAGKLSAIPEKYEEFSAYEYNEPALININDTTYSALTGFIGSIETGGFDVKEYTDAVYIVGRLPISAADITQSVYGTIEQQLAASAYVEYISSFYDDVEVNKDSVAKFNMNTIPSLEDEFYK